MARRTTRRSQLLIRAAVISIVVICSAWFTLTDDDGGAAPADVHAAISGRLSGVMMTIGATVVRVLPDDLDGDRHQRLLVALPEPIDGVETILIAHNIDLAPRVPCVAGDLVRVRGEYKWNNKGGLLHWTHHDPEGRREGGWIEFDGDRYE
ncbi:MAG: DUF3465 domain-containing protein [Phycisphaerales bacterium]|nr:DUF3465 domain-containing protein [Phycisphaerales bacterium]